MIKIKKRKVYRSLPPRYLRVSADPGQDLRRGEEGRLAPLDAAFLAGFLAGFFAGRFFTAGSTSIPDRVIGLDLKIKSIGAPARS